MPTRAHLQKIIAPAATESRVNIATSITAGFVQPSLSPSLNDEILALNPRLPNLEISFFLSPASPEAPSVALRLGNGALTVWKPPSLSEPGASSALTKLAALFDSRKDTSQRSSSRPALGIGAGRNQRSGRDVGAGIRGAR